MKRKDDIMGRRIACHELVEELVRRWYPTMSAMEIVNRFGLNCHYSTIERYGRSLGVKKDASFREAWNKKVGAANRRTYLMERLRVQSGMPKRTGKRVRTAPERVYLARFFLIHRHGYIRTKDMLVLLYDSNTKRSKMEERYTQRLGIRFYPEG